MLGQKVVGECSTEERENHMSRVPRTLILLEGVVAISLDVATPS